MKFGVLMINGYVFLKGVKSWDELHRMQAEGRVRAVAQLVTGEFSALVAVHTDDVSSLKTIADELCTQSQNGCIVLGGPHGPVTNHPMGIFPSDAVLFGIVELDMQHVLGYVDYALGIDGVAAVATHGGDIHALVEATGETLEEATQRLSSALSHVAVKNVRTSLTSASLMVGAGPAS